MFWNTVSRGRERERDGGMEGGFNQVARRGEEGFLFASIVSIECPLIGPSP